MPLLLYDSTMTMMLVGRVDVREDEAGDAVQLQLLKPL